MRFRRIQSNFTFRSGIILLFALHSIRVQNINALIRRENDGTCHLRTAQYPVFSPERHGTETASNYIGITLDMKEVRWDLSLQK